MPEREQRCETCKWWKPCPRCTRRKPKDVLVEFFPPTRDKPRCGEWEAREAEPAPEDVDDN